MADRLSGRVRAILVALVAAVTIAGVTPALAVLCTGPEGFGTCHRKIRPHVGEFPFAVTVSESENRVIVVDLFNGLGYKYPRANISNDPIIFSGPLPSPVTYSGIAYTPADELFWVATTDGGGSHTLVQSSLAGVMIAEFPLTSPGGGYIGDISYNSDTMTFWGCDLESDMYFEFNPDGTLTGVDFLSPAIAYGADAFGTGIAVATLAGTKVLDIPMGIPSQLQPTEVRRFDTSGTEIGQVYQLSAATSPSQAWVTGIAYTSTGSQPTPTEFVVDAIGNFLYEVPVLEQSINHVTNLTCTVTDTNAVDLSWVNNQTYAGIRVMRDGLVLETLTFGAESFTDTTADEGTHTYVIQVMQTSSSPWTASLSCDAVTGPGRLLTAVAHQGSNPFGIAVDEDNDEVYVLDLDGQLHRYTRTLDYIGAEATLAAGSTLTGLTIMGGELYMVDATLGQLIRATNPTPGPVTLLESVPFQSPLGGAVGGISFDETTGTFWAVDVSQNIYFQFNADGSLVADSSISFSAGNGNGNGVTSIGATGLIDITAGSTGSPIVDRVVRLDGAGAEQMFEYDVTPTTQAGFVNGLVYTDEGFNGDPGEYLVGNDTNVIYAISLLSQGAPFVRGDVNGDGTINLIDATFHLQVLFGTTSPTFTCADALDVDDDGILALPDVIYSLAFLFTGGPPPPAPFPACEIDPTDDANSCDTFDGC